MKAGGISLKRQLLLWLLLPQLVLWLLGGFLAYRVALKYGERGIDQSLTQSVRSLARQVKPIGSGLLIDFPRAAQAILEEDPKDKVAYMVSSPPGSFILGNSKLPPPLPGPMPEGEIRLHDAVLDGAAIRVASLELAYGDGDPPQRLRVQVAKSQALRNAIARELVADMLLPLLGIGLLLSALVYSGVSGGLQPLRRLQTQLGHRSGGQAVSDLAPIELSKAPREVHALAGAVNELLSAVQRSLSQEKRFLNDAAHQLRTPLAGLKSQAELALGETDPDKLRARLEKVRAGAERSAHLVHQLLALARAEPAAALQPVDLAQLAREVAREWAPRAMAARIDFGYEGVSSLALSADPLLLREALTNLVDNALRYAGPHTRVTLRVRDDATQGYLEVEDSGPGMSADARARAFERFFRASDLAGGCGLGLSIVQEIALRHGGQARLLPLQPQGLVAQIVLPLKRGPVA